MGNWLVIIKKYWFRRPDTYRRVREAYLNRDSSYLRNAYRYGREYTKKTVISHLREIQTQKNFNFLMEELKMVENEALELLVYTCLLDYLLNEKIQVSDTDSLYLNKKLDLLEKLYQEDSGNQVRKENGQKNKNTSSPLRNRLKDHLGMLEKMKRQFHP